jgi:hypothetical protein
MYPEWEALLMETVYEKVCPACGRSASLAAKFCSGCGHQYRTVFHDQAGAADSQDESTSESGSHFDARWAPVVAIVPVVIVMMMVAARPQTVQVAPPQTATVASYATAPAAGASAIATGMRPVDVQQALGRPDNVKFVAIGGANTEQWYYTRSGHTLEVHFNSNDVVDNWTNY